MGTPLHNYTVRLTHLPGADKISKKKKKKEEYKISKQHSKHDLI